MKLNYSAFYKQKSQPFLRVTFIMVTSYVF